MKDFIAELEAARRTVASGTLPAGAAHVVTLTRTYPADVEDLWDAVTNPERIPRWFLPVSGDLRLGGTYQTDGNAGGEIRVCDAPRHLRLTWVMGPPTPQDASIVDVRLEPLAEGTRLTLEHTAVVPAEFWDTYGPGSVGVGWDGALLGLALHLDDGEGPIAPEEQGTDPRLRAFNTASSEAWGAALAAADGLDADTVAARVAATTAFYVPPLDPPR
ncbi:SRPBCC family protein [Cellulosimicrobium arenosum]|uniref:SRPBCC family protein n=1 Tax=Cellulosimicrobium arenosum TaxID=2708133 RepID=A0A927PGJ8_9MICO|nr:SRPBCC family protein [Cellulosimicrobium arenosum]MBD8080255.1 SRPBCC family protein [Cellulosimicrobium arenosum]